MNYRLLCLITGLFFTLTTTGLAQKGETWISFEPDESDANGKNIVLVSGDDEYRSEEALPMLAKIFTTHHGFRTTVLFAIDPETGYIKPDHQTNIPGMQNLQEADLMILFTRFRELPDQDMHYFDEYLREGKPIIAIRTSTHAFHYQRNPDSPYAKYDFRSDAEGWEGGFGRKILGETWIDHHGDHGSEGTQGLIDGINERNDHSILKGVSNIWGPTDVYGITEPEEEINVLVWGQSTSGMTPDAPVNREKPIMPVAWTKSYQVEDGQEGKAFTTTMGSSQDFENEDLRRLIVNAAYWALDMEGEQPDHANVEIIGDYDPTPFGFGNYIQGRTPEYYK